MNRRTIDFRFAPRVTWTAIGRPDDPCKTVLGQDGALLYGFELMFDRSEGWLFHRTYSFNVANGGDPVHIAQHTEKASNPITVTEVEYAKARLTLRAFGHQHDGDKRTDVVLWSIEPKEGVRDFLTGLGITVQDTRDYFFLKDFGYTGHRVDCAPMSAFPDAAWRFGMKKEFKKGTKIRPAFCAYPYALSGYAGKHSSTAAAFVHGYQECRHGKGLRGAVLVPQNHQEYARFDWKWAQEALKRERKYWAATDLQKIKMRVSDEAVMDMISAAARNLLQAREVKDGIVEFQVGACHYRSLWVTDGYFMLEAARYLGYHRDADQGFAALLRRARKDGSITQLSFHTKETAIAVATLVRYAEMTDDWDALRGYWPIVQKAVEFIQTLRAEARAYSPSHPAYRLMPESFGDGGLGGGRAEYTTSCWTLVCLFKAAEAARRLGLDKDGEAFQASFEELKSDFRFRAGQTMKRLPDGLPYLPMWISGGDHVHGVEGPVPVDSRLKPAGGTWAFCQAIYPGEIFAPDDPLVQNFLALLDRIDDDEGIPMETGWMPHQGLWTYYASFAAHAWLYGGRPDKAVDYLYAFANHAAPTRVWREEQSLKKSGLDLWWGDMPHNWASAEFIRLVRHLLVLERFEGLDLLYGLPNEWLGEIVVEDTPTRYGPVSLRTRLDNQGGLTIDVGQSTSWSRQAKEVRLHLPQAVVPSSVRCNGQAVQVKGGVVRIEPGAAKTRLRATLRKRRS